MRWKVETAGAPDLDKKRDRNGARPTSAAKDDIVVRQIVGELGRPLSAPSTRAKKDSANYRVRRRKKVTAIMRTPNWRRDTKKSTSEDLEPYLQHLERKRLLLQLRRTEGARRPATSSGSRLVEKGTGMFKRTEKILSFTKKYSVGTKAIAARAKGLGRWLEHSALPLSIRGRPLLADDLKHGPTSQIHNVFKSCFTELTKECSLLCGEHGKLMDKIWNYYVEALVEAYELRGQGSQGSILSSSESLASSVGKGKLLNKASPRVTTEIQAPAKKVGDESTGQKFKGKVDDGAATMPSKITRRSSLLRKNPTLSPIAKDERAHNNLEHLKRDVHALKRLGMATPLFHAHDDTSVSGDDHGSEKGINRKALIPEALQKRIRIIAEQAVSLRRLRQSIFSEYVSGINAEIKATNMEHTEDAFQREVVDVPEILQLTDEEKQKKNMMELVERRAREANERLKKNKTLSTSEKAKKIEEEKEMKRACTLIQSAYRQRQARERMQLLRSQALLKANRFDFNAYIRSRTTKKGKWQGSMELHDATKIMEEYVWESKRLVRDMSMDWWKQKKETQRKEERLQATCERKNESLAQIQHQVSGLIKSVGDFVATLNFDNKSEKVKRVLAELQDELNDSSKSFTADGGEKHCRKVCDLTTKILNSSTKVYKMKRDNDMQTDGDPNAEPVVKKAEVKETKKKKLSKKQKSRLKRRRIKLQIELGSLSDYVHFDSIVKGTPSTIDKLLRFIDEVYHEKIEYDEVDDKENHKRHSMAEFVHDHLFRKYGLRSLADKHTFNLVSSLKLHIDHPKIKLFARFCQCGIKHCDPLPLAALDFFLYVVAYFHTLEDKYGKDLLFTDPDIPTKTLMNVQSALYAVPTVMGVLLNNGPKMTGELELDQLKIMFNVKLKVKEMSFKHHESQVIEVDILNDILMNCFESIWDALEDMLRTLFTEGDVDSDGVMTFDEFSDLVLSLHPETSENKLHRMFKFALKSLDDPTSHEITPDAFLLAAQELGFLSGDHKTFMPPRPMKMSELIGKSDDGNDVGELWALQKEHDASQYTGKELTDAEWTQQRAQKKEKQFEKQFEVHEQTWTDVKGHLDANKEALENLKDDPMLKEKVDEIHVLRTLLEDQIENKQDAKEARSTLHKLNRRVSNIPLLNEEEMAALEQIVAVDQGDDSDLDEDLEDHREPKEEEREEGTGL